MTFWCYGKFSSYVKQFTSTLNDDNIQYHLCQFGIIVNLRVVGKYKLKELVDDQITEVCQVGIAITWTVAHLVV